MAPIKQYDADKQVSEMIPTEIIVDGSVWKVRRTGTALKRIIELNPAPEKRPKGKEDDPMENIDVLYESISVLLVNEEGEHPDPEKLSDTLDFEVAQDLMSKFLPRREEGNAEETPSEADTSTTT